MAINIDLATALDPLFSLRGVTTQRQQPTARTTQQGGMLDPLSTPAAPMTVAEQNRANIGSVLGRDARPSRIVAQERAAKQGVDINTPQGLMQAAQIYDQLGDSAKSNYYRTLSLKLAQTQKEAQQKTEETNVRITNLQNSIVNQAAAAGLPELGEAAKYITDPKELQDIALKIPELSKNDWKSFGGGSTLLYRNKGDELQITDAAGDSKAPRVTASEIFDNYLGKADADEFNQARVNVVGLIQDKLNQVRENDVTGVITQDELQQIMKENLAPDTTVDGARQMRIFSPREQKDVWVERYTEGSTAYQNLRSAAQANISLVQSKLRDYGNTLRQAKRALEQVQQGKDAAGFFGYFISAVPGTDPFEFNELIRTIKANIGFDTLQQMRDNSPTGGALGQVSNQEIGFLQSALASLRPGISQEDYIENLGIVIDKYQDIMEKLQEKPNYNVYDEMDSLAGFHNEYQTSVYGSAYPRTVAGGAPIPVEPQPLPDEQNIVDDILGSNP